MKSDYLDKMKKVACDVFEQLAFMFAEEIEIQDFEYNDGPLIHATMSFSGYRSGTIDITMPMPLASQFARNILGLDESIEIDSQHYEDAVRELLNTICGRMLTSLFGEAEVFDLHVPTTEYLNVDKVKELIQSGYCFACIIEEMPLLIRLFV